MIRAKNVAINDTVDKAAIKKAYDLVIVIL